MKGSIAAAGLAVLAACSSGGAGGNDQAAQGEKSAASAPAGAGGSLAMQPGQWEMRTEIVRMNMPNMPAGVAAPTPPATTVTYCLTPEQARSPDANFFTGKSQSSGCRAENMSVAGGRISGTVQCDNQGATARIELAGQFTPTSYELNQTIHTSAQGVNVDMESRTTARRIGDCPG